jgi:hypothetical protein
MKQGFIRRHDFERFQDADLAHEIYSVAVAMVEPAPAFGA